MQPHIHGFDVLGPLGAGAMSSVWKARDLASGLLVALKVLHPHVATSPAAVERFEREVRAYQKLAHRNVIACLGAGPSDGGYYAALELLEGGDLRVLVAGAGRLPPETAAFVLSEVLAGLAHAHRAGMAHRDVKPENVMVTTDGTPKLADFGIATHVDAVRETAAGRLVGTPAYMAPEQIGTDRAADPSGDLWGAGVLLYEMVVGVNPFAADTIDATVARVRRLTPPPLGYRATDVPEELEGVAARLLSRDPARRAASVDEVREALLTVVGRHPDWASSAALVGFRDDPAGSARRWAEGAASRRLRAARSLLRSSEPRHAAARYEAGEALAVMPSSGEAEALIAALGRERSVTTEPAASKERISELERAAQEESNNVQALVNLVRAARSRGDDRLAARAYVWGRRRSGDDPFALAQLASALGFDLAAHFERTTAAELRARVHGAETADTRPPAPTERGSFLASRWVWLGTFALAAGLVWNQWRTAAVDVVVAVPPTAPRVLEVPDPGLIYLDKARFVAQAGDVGRALAIYQRFLSEMPDHGHRTEALLGEAMALDELGRDTEARARYDHLLAAHATAPEAAIGRRRLVHVLERTGHLDLALAAVAPLIASTDFGDRADARLIEARLRAALGDSPEAAAIYRDVLATSTAPYLRARARFGMGAMLFVQNDPEASYWLTEAAKEAGTGSNLAAECDRLLRAIDERRAAAEAAAVSN